ncbi:MAG: ATP-binding protein [Chloroflexi bacterium]|nr:ATP-binding protein [Chloroflexota bacterium]
MADIERQFVHLARLAMENRSDDAIMLIRKALSGLSKRRPDLQTDISYLLGRVSGNGMVRAVSDPLPVDLDSRLELLRRDYSPSLDVEPIWSPSLGVVFKEIISERAPQSKLHELGVEPTKSLLFRGLPGTGKTLAARWLARELSYPLFTLDLSAVMSSFLGRTGNNLRVVLDYARLSQVVLLLDEFDAIAKRRDDDSEIGELKRLVTVILQEIESWPSHSLLIAATNHPDLLDPAVWRRFDRTIEFPLPTKKEIEALLSRIIPPEQLNTVPLSLVKDLFSGRSFADVTRTVSAARRSAIVRNQPFLNSLLEIVAEDHKSGNRKSKLSLAAIMNKTGLSQRQIAAFTGLSRDTIRSHFASTETAPSNVDT